MKNAVARKSLRDQAPLRMSAELDLSIVCQARIAQKQASE
jgi:hypothetical protein